jgi:ubiquinone/menaquinone biosynthesis C-methylase UbiE
MSSLIDFIHRHLVSDRRITVLARQLAELLPPNASVLDVGCGPGTLTARVAAQRPDCTFRGIDVMVRPDSVIPVDLFDGQHIPLADASVDVVMFVDVLHHTDDPNVLLREARRVARRCVVIKDHRRDGFLAGPTLRVMDWVGNAHHGVRLPYNYLSEREWREAFAAAGLTPDVWQQRLGIHSAVLDPLVGRELHFLARLA